MATILLFNIEYMFKVISALLGAVSAINISDFGGITLGESPTSA